jgi:molybdopterin adenylyltransferase
MSEQKHGHTHAHGGSAGEVRVGILTCSDRGARGERADVSGPTIHNLVVDQMHAKVAQYRVVPDDRSAIESTLIEWVDEHKLDLILTTGGTGFSPRDVTPEATKAVVERETPAIVQAMLFESLRVTPYAMLTRATAGIRRRTLIINLPGSPKAVTENFDAISEVLPHAIDIMRGIDTHGAPGGAKAKHDDHAGHGSRVEAPTAGGHESHEHRREGSQAQDHRHGQVAGGDAEMRDTRPAGGIARNVGGPPC